MIWCISPVLSLQNDQKIKLRTRSDLNGNSFTVINLDDYNNTELIPTIYFTLCTNLPQNPPSEVDTSFNIFFPPQLLNKYTKIQEIFRYQVDSGACQSLNIGKTYLVVQFGLYFRDEFLLQKIIIPAIFF